MLIGTAKTAGDLGGDGGGGDHDGSGSGITGQVMEDCQDGSERPADRTKSRPSTEDWAAMTAKQQKNWRRRRRRLKDPQPLTR